MTVGTVHNTGLPVIALVAVGLVALLTGLCITQQGISVNHDSIIFILSARNLASHGHLAYPSFWNGNLVPPAHYGPLYPIILGGLGLITDDYMLAARWLNICLLSLSTLLVGLFLLRHGRAPVFMALVGSLLFTVSPYILEMHRSVMSEPLLYFTSLLALFLLAEYLRSFSLRLLILSACALSLTLLAKYQAVTLLPAAVLTVFWLGHDHDGIRRRASHAALFIAICLCPTVVWMIHNELAVGTGVAPNPLRFSFPLQYVRDLVGNLSLFLIPWGVEKPLRYGLFAFLLAQVVLALSRWCRERNICQDAEWRTVGMLAMSLLSYVLGIMTISSVMDGLGPQMRYLSPMYPLAILLSMQLIARACSSEPRRRWVLYTSGVLSMIILASSAGYAIYWKLSSDGRWQVFASTDWQKSSLMSSVRRLDSRIHIWTNAPDAVLYLADRPAVFIPTLHIDGGGAVAKKDKSDSISDKLPVQTLLRDIRDGSGVLVYFRSVDWRYYQPSEDEIRKAISINMVEEHPDGAIYR